MSFLAKSIVLAFVLQCTQNCWIRISYTGQLFINTSLAQSFVSDFSWWSLPQVGTNANQKLMNSLHTPDVNIYFCLIDIPTHFTVKATCEVWWVDSTGLQHPKSKMESHHPSHLLTSLQWLSAPVSAEGVSASTTVLAVPSKTPVSFWVCALVRVLSLCLPASGSICQVTLLTLHYMSIM